MVMVNFFFHAKGGEEFNWRHVSQKKIERNGDISPAKPGVKTGQSISPQTGTREPPLTVVLKRSLALQRM
jgi:hypothetical protein